MSIKSHWQKVDWSGSVATFTTALKMSWGFTSHRIILNWRQGGPVQFSFDGVETHGEIGDPVSGYLQTLEFSEFRSNKIWFKGGAVSPPQNIVEFYVTPRDER